MASTSLELRTTVVTLTATAAAVASDSLLCRQVFLQPDVANVGPCYFGGSNVTSSTGLRLEGADSDGLPSAPFPFVMSVDKPFDLAALYVLGTVGEKLRILYIPY